MSSPETTDPLPFLRGSDEPLLQAAADEIERLRAVYEAARGLCFGADWNAGSQARMHGYRKKLIAAVDAIESLPPGTW